MTSQSDPHPAPDRHEPRRAEPLQPDKPGSGNRTEDEAADEADREAAKHSEEQLEQARAAHENVREGY